MANGWFLLSLAGPPVVAVIAGTTLRNRDPDPQLVIGLNALMPGAGLAAAGRPLLEVAMGVLLSQVALLVLGGPDRLIFWVPVAIIGALWANAHAGRRPRTTGSRPAASSPRPLVVSPTPAQQQQQPAQRPAPPSAPRPPQQSQPGQGETEEEAGYAVTLRCTECGADTDVPVMHHMAHCTYCGSNHLLVGQDDTIHLTIPERCTDEESLCNAVLDHYRYQHYLKLYKRQVAPIEGRSTAVTDTGRLTALPEMEAAAAAAEATVSRQADAFRARLAGSLELGHQQHFLAPYRHGTGTLYQAAFGRDKKSEMKQLRFALRTIEASTLATGAIDLPDMGRLSYLRALVPVAHYGQVAKVLPLEADEQALHKAYGDLDRKQLVRDIRVIRLGSAFTQHVGAVVWRPYWIAEVHGPGIDETLLVDSATGSVSGTAGYLNPEVLENLPEEATAPGRGLRFLPMECPTCGHEFTFDADAVLHFCANCHRVCGVHNGQKYDVEYSYGQLPDDDGFDLIPFWAFPLRLRTGDGKLLTDLLHLKDGIDGTLDQIGDDAPVRQHTVLVPAIRCITSKLMAQAFNRLFIHVLKTGPRLHHDRFPLDIKPTPWEVGVEEPEARHFAPLYLANAFGPRDIARVNVHQVAAWLFEARMEARGRLAYVPIPLQVTRPFREYIGRSRGQALDRAAGKS